MLTNLIKRTLTSQPQTAFNSLRLLSVSHSLFGEVSPDLRSRIQKLVDANDIVLFMKGTPEQPMCGFSRNAKKILEFHGVQFKTYNVLDDDELRQGIKEYSDWPTIPQVYVKGKFVGGSDILLQMHKDGEITDFLETNGIKSKFSEQ
ncbi:Glutaredoxin domain containing protein [Aphelenchoides bicaudatus]|nr:Glutaredoxin domain containing protein [Aphelenchoides bicaudatus]